MNNEDKLKALKWWQTCGFFHEFTCSTNPLLKQEHDNCAMVPVEIDGRVHLRCPICNRLQSHALDIAFDAYAKKDILEEQFKKFYVTEEGKDLQERAKQYKAL